MKLVRNTVKARFPGSWTKGPGMDCSFTCGFLSLWVLILLNVPSFSLPLSLSPSSQFPSLPFSFFLPSLSSNRCRISIMARKYSEQSVHFTVHFLVLTFGTGFPRDEVAGHKSPPLLKVDLSSVLYYLCQLRQEFCKTRLKT